MSNDPPLSCSAAPKCENDMYLWLATIVGPPNTPFAGGIYFFEIQLPQNYPLSPPKVKCLTKIYHPNITMSNLCLDIFGSNWSSSFTIAIVLLAI